MCASEDSHALPDVRCEHTVSEPPTDTDLQEVLEEADNILCEAREDVPGDVPGVLLPKHGKGTKAVLDSIHKNDIHYLKGCRSVRFFRIADGLSLHMQRKGPFSNSHHS